MSENFRDKIEFQPVREGENRRLKFLLSLFISVLIAIVVYRVALSFQQAQRENQVKLEEATILAEEGSLEEAIKLAENIPSGSPVYQEALSQIEQWRTILIRREEREKNHEALQKAYNLAVDGNFSEAIKVAETIPTNAANYEKARGKIEQWSKLEELSNK